MEKTIGNHLTQPNRTFPVDCETLDSLAVNQFMAEILGNIAGDKVILRGCQLSGNGLIRSEGYVFLRTTDYPLGEVLHFEGGMAVEALHLQKQNINVSANGTTYASAYTKRWLSPGAGTESYSWADFIDLTDKADYTEGKNIRALIQRVADLEQDLGEAQGVPVGTIQMWAGTTAPTNYLLCDGGSFVATEYPKLQLVLGSTNTPDLKGRFIVGYDSRDTNPDPDYTTIGNVGGEPKHTLTIEEIPPHSHSYTRPLQVSKINDQQAKYWVSPGNEEAQTGTIGGGLAHENRPPYYVLAYIIKAR